MKIVFKLIKDVSSEPPGQFPMALMYHPVISSEILINFSRTCLEDLHTFLSSVNANNIKRNGFVHILEEEKDVLLNFFKTIGYEVEDNTSANDPVV